MARVQDVAAVIRVELGSLSPWKLQKLVYYAQAWSLVWDNKPLFVESIEAWREGPVCPALRDGLDIQMGSAQLADAERATIKAVVDFYGQFSTKQLIHLTHCERPWRQARGTLPPDARSNVVISHDSLRDCYGPAATNGTKEVPEPVKLGLSWLLEIPEADIDKLTEQEPVDGDAAIQWLETGENDPWQEG